MVEEYTTRKEFIRIMMEHSKYFVWHQWLNHWQKEKLHAITVDPPADEPVATADFSERCKSIPSVEFGDMYRFARSIALLPIAVDRKSSEGSISYEAHIYLSDMHRQDPAVVMYCIENMVEDFRRRNIVVKHMYLLTDGCAGQFKGAKAFYTFSKIARKYNIVITQACPATAHGKCKSDGIGAAEKKDIHAEELKTDSKLDLCSDNVSMADAVYAYKVENKLEPVYNPKKSRVDGQKLMYKRYHNYNNKIVHDTPDVDTLTVPIGDPMIGGRGSQRLNSFQYRPNEPEGVVHCRNVFCCCDPCKVHDYAKCEEKAYVSKWVKVQLKLKQTAASAEPEDLEPEDLDPDSEPEPEEFDNEERTQDAEQGGPYSENISCFVY
jgi:hypothetical protein